MKNQDLKLQFIENGRLSDGKMTQIVGGALEKCRTLTECTHGEENKRTCSGYKNCDSALDKFKCSNYQDFVLSEPDSSSYKAADSSLFSK